ncbi:hypothetical protein ABIB25_001418 [Nakamurella sp. UYEF19]|uniref:hypothetical protein n=1 Tax=Nakamurella sp. UYEF19 TaxID=1756392 RepID=UPI0033955A36
MGGEITLPRAGRLRRGYSVVEVDAVPHPILDTSDRNLIRNPLFNSPPIGERGYDEGSVGALITLIGEAVDVC